LVCEEAHRYASADRSIGFGPTRRSISRIAKEGRKHGVFLGLVSQRPAELDATIISQCNTLFAMRMINDRDQTILRSAVSDASANLLDFLPSLGTGEVFAFGQGVALPARVKLKQLPPHLLPKSDAAGSARRESATAIDAEFVTAVLQRWRGLTAGQPMRGDEGALEQRDAVPASIPPAATQSSGDAPRPPLLKRALNERLDIARAFQAPARPHRVHES
jgi:DNA helicase HerA-like ATPase